MKGIHEFKSEEKYHSNQQHHFPCLIFISDSTETHSPSFFSYLDPTAIEIDGKTYYRFWLLLEEKLSMDSLHSFSPIIEEEEEYNNLYQIPAFFCPFIYLRQEGNHCYFLYPGFYLARKWLAENPRVETGNEWKRESQKELAHERIFLSFKPNASFDPSEVYFRTGSTRQYFASEFGEMVYVFPSTEKFYRNNTCVKEIHWTIGRGVVEITLYNHYMDRTSSRLFSEERGTMTWSCKLVD